MIAAPHSAPIPPNQTSTVAPILLTGATGKIGRRGAARLQHMGHTFRRATRGTDPSFDWTAPGTWPAVLQGVDVAYLAYAPDISFLGAPAVVGAFAVTVIRSSCLAQNSSEEFFQGVCHGRTALPAPGDVGEAVVDAEDVADAVVAAVLNHSQHETIEIGGTRLLTPTQIAAILAQAAGRPVIYEELAPAAFRTDLEGIGTPTWLADPYTRLFAEIMDGRNAQTVDGIKRLLGRPARDLVDVAREIAATGVWARTAAGAR